MTPLERLCSENLPRSHGFEPLRVDGRIPRTLNGTLYRTGAGRFDSHGRRYQHIFEADGAVTGVRMTEGTALGATRVIRSEGLMKEEKAGRPLYGSAASWFRRMLNTHLGRVKNTGNTNVIPWQTQLLALMEAAKPTRIDPNDLNALGETSLDDVVRGRLCAHPHRVPKRRASYAFGVHYGKDTRIEIYELPDHGAARHLSTMDLKRPPMLHDFMATPDHLVFLVPPAQVNLPKMLLQLGTFKDVWQWCPENGTEVIIVPIDRPDQPIRFQVDPFFLWHFANGFERDQTLFLDLVHYHDFASFEAIGSAQPTNRGGSYRRLTINPKTESVQFETIFDGPCDFPRIDPREEATPHKQCWVITEELPQRLVRLNAETGATDSFSFGEKERASEAVIVPSADQNVKHAFSLVYDAECHASYLAIFDAESVSSGPMARAWFDHHIPITFHGNWLPGADSTG